MVNSLSATNTIQNNQIQTCQKENLGKLVKYVNNQALKEVPDTFTSDVKGSLVFAGLFEGIPFLKSIFKNKKLTGKFITNNMKSIDNVTKETLKGISSGTEKFTKKVSDFVNTCKKTKEAYLAEKKAVSASINWAKNGDKLTKTLEAAKTAQNTAEQAANNAKVFKKLNELKAAKLTKKVEKLSGKINNLNGGAAEKAKELKSVINNTKKSPLEPFKSKNARNWFLFSLAIEGLTEILPTFKELGFKKGIKQLAKSAVKCAGDTVGFIAGEAIGTTLGTAIGTALFPGVGTVIGAISGMVVGGIGSFLMGKITGKITGKSEREKAQEENEKQTVEQIANNQSAQTELIEAAKAKIQEEAALNGGELSEDSQLALEAINNLNQTNPFATTV